MRNSIVRSFASRALTSVFLLGGKSGLLSSIAVAMLVVPRCADAASCVWTTSPKNGKLNDSSNWDTLPVVGSALCFGSSSITSLINDFASGTVFAGLTFNPDASSYVINGAAITLTGGISNLSTSTQSINTDIVAHSVLPVTLSPSGGDIVLNGNISGPGGGLMVTGVGSLTISGSNSFSGATLLNCGGAVNIGSDCAFGNGGVITIVSTANLSAYGNPHSISNAMTLAECLLVTGTNNLTLAGSLTNSGGNRILTSSILGDSGALIVTGNLYLSESTTGRNFTLGGVGPTILAGTIANDASSTGGAGTLIINNSGTTTVCGNNAYTGVTMLSGSGGTVGIGSDSAFGNGGTMTVGSIVNLLSSGGAHTIPNPVLLLSSPTIVGTNSLTLATVTVSGAARTITNNIPTLSGTVSLSGNVYLSESAAYGRALVLSGSGNFLVSGTISNYSGGTGPAGNLQLNTTGTVSLTAPNSYTGTTTIGAGTVLMGNARALGSGALNFSGGTLINATGGPVSLNNPVSLEANPPGEISGTCALTFSGTVGNGYGGSPTLMINNTGLTTFAGPFYLTNSAMGRTITIGGSGNVVFAGTIANGGSGSSHLTLANTGTTVLAGSNSYTGRTTLGTEGSTVVLNNDYALSSGSVGLSNGVTLLSTDGTHTLNNLFTLNSGNSISAVVGGSNTLIFSGTVANTRASTAKMTVNDTGGLIFSGTVYPARIISSTSSQALVLDGSGPILISGLVSDGWGVSSLTYSGSNTLTITGSNRYTGLTTINSGTLAVSGSGTLGASGVANLTIAGGVLDLGNTIQNVGLVSITGGTVENGTLSGTCYNANVATGTASVSANLLGSGAALTKTGAGLLSVSGSINIAAVNVNQGCLTLTQSVTLNALDIGPSGSLSLTANAGAPRVIDVSAFSLSGSGAIDLWDNAMIVRASGASENASNLTAIRAAVNSASHGLLWDGMGIGSSVAIDEASRTQALAVMVYDNTVLRRISFEGASGLGSLDENNTPTGFNQVFLKLTYLGDFNADGRIDSFDYAWLDNYALSGNMLGDLNGDGVTNATDYTWLDGAALNQHFGAFAVQPSGNDAPVSQTGSAGPNPIPEPGSIRWMIVGASLWLINRRYRAVLHFPKTPVRSAVLC